MADIIAIGTTSQLLGKEMDQSQIASEFTREAIGDDQPEAKGFGLQDIHNYRAG